MEAFKDLLRFVALLLVIHAVITNSVASAICAGTLYTGGFGEMISFLPKRQRKKTKLRVVSREKEVC